MTLRTEINVEHFPFEIGHGAPTLLVGSCFTENIGLKLSKSKIPTLINPFGVLYNPTSVGNCIDTLIKNIPITEDELGLANGLWFSYDFHSKFSSPDKAQCINNIRRAIDQGQQFLQKAQVIIATFGTARMYRQKSNNKVVANCHKIAARNFIQQLQEPEEIELQWVNRIEKLLRINPEIKIIFTISPIRHWKDGAAGNQLSKAILHVATHRIISHFPESTHYFPSYEIMMDDLRDYRFYADDMLHPTPLAIEYIWEKFRESVFSKTTNSLIDRIDSITKASQHRPFCQDSESHKKFVQQTLNIIEGIKTKHPEISFDDEIAALTGGK